MKSSKPVRVAVVGAGHWGVNYVRILVGIVGVEHVSVVDSDSSALARIKKQFRGLRVESRLDSIVRDREFSAAVVSTPAASHYDVVRLCLQSGMDVLAEKPLTLEVGQAERLAHLAHRKDLILMVGHTFLYNPAVRKMRDLLAAGTCGDIYYMKATRTHLGLIRTDVNAVWDLAPHDVSIFNYLTEACPLSVSAIGGCFLKKDKEDVAFIALHYPRNILAHIHVSWADSNKERTVEVVGSKARIVFDDLNALERVKIFEKGIGLSVPADPRTYGEFLFALRDGDIISPKIAASEPLADLCREFLDCVASRKQPLADAQNGVQVVRVMCAIEESLKHDGRMIRLRRSVKT